MGEERGGESGIEKNEEGVDKRGETEAAEELVEKGRRQRRRMKNREE